MYLKRLSFVLTALLLVLSVVTGCAKDTAQPLDQHKTETVKADEQKSKAPEKQSEDKSDENKASTENDQQKAVEKSSDSQAEGTEKKSEATQAKTEDKASPSNVSAPKQSETKQEAQKSTSVSSASQEQTEKKTEEKPPKPMATVTITGYQGKTIVAATKVEIEENDTVFNVTKRILQSRGIAYSKSGLGATLYIQGIQNDYEFDHGPKSGWLAMKNGKALTKSAGLESVHKGDTIHWIYTMDYTKNGG